MATQDAPDWQNVVTVVSGGVTDAPDWQQIVAGPGGTAVGGYASLTGPGQTTTPGRLTQAGELIINNVSSGFILFISGTGTSSILCTSGSGGTALNSSGQVNFHATSAAGSGNQMTIEVSNALSAGTISLHNAGSGDIDLQADAGRIILDAGSGGGPSALGISVTQHGTAGHGMALALEGNSIQFFTGLNLAALSTPTGIAFGYTQDGHIYFYPSGGPWALLV